MTSKHLIDPQLLSGLAMLPQEDLSAETLARFRTMMAELTRLRDGEPASHPAVCREEVMVPALDGAPPVRLLTYSHSDKSRLRPAYFYIHGGGYVLGTADMADANCAYLAAELDCVVTSVDYRLAPETVFPGNVEDCYAALKWLHDNAATLGADPQRIAIGGDSAGGGLAAALALLARDRGEIPIIHQQLVYPMLDDRDPDNTHPHTGEFGWTRAANRFGWRSLLGREPGGDDVSPYAAAARAENLAGLPRAFISVGALDLFLESNLEYARRLTRAGVAVELHVYPGAYHGSDIIADARVTQQHKRDQLEALRTVFKSGSQSGGWS